MEFDLDCPYCGEPISVWIDPGGGGAQRYEEDCSVCCRPIAVSAHDTGEGEYDVSARRLDD